MLDGLLRALGADRRLARGATNAVIAAMTEARHRRLAIQ